MESQGFGEKARVNHADGSVPPVVKAGDGGGALKGSAVGLGAAQADFDSELSGEGRFGVESEVGVVSGIGVDHLNVVGLVAAHHLVARYAIGDGVHDRPLGRGFLPAAFGFFARELNRLGATEVHFEFAAFDEDATPHDLAGPGDAADSAAAQTEIHGRLAKGLSAFVAIDVMRRRSTAGDQEHPYVVPGGAALIEVAPTKIV